MKKYVIGLGLCAHLLLHAHPGQALGFSFSFTNDSGDIAGTVTGQVLGLQDNMSSQSATSVILNSIPAAYSAIGSTPTPGGFGTDVVSWPDVSSNTWDVSAGAVTAAQIIAGTATGTTANRQWLRIVVQSGSPTTGVAHFGEDLNGDAGIPFSEQTVAFQTFPASAFVPLPEPGALLLWSTGLVGLLIHGWRRKTARL
jgi:hypothetical protein